MRVQSITVKWVRTKSRKHTVEKLSTVRNGYTARIHETTESKIVCISFGSASMIADLRIAQESIGRSRANFPSVKNTRNVLESSFRINIFCSAPSSSSVGKSAEMEMSGSHYTIALTSSVDVALNVIALVLLVTRYTDTLDQDLLDTIVLCTSGERRLVYLSRSMPVYTK